MSKKWGVKMEIKMNSISVVIKGKRIFSNTGRNGVFTMTFFECCETVRRDGLQLIRPRRGATGQYDLKPPYTGPSGEWGFLDAVTANLVCQLCAALPVSRQEGFKRLPAGKILTLCRRAADGA